MVGTPTLLFLSRVSCTAVYRCVPLNGTAVPLCTAVYRRVPLCTAQRYSCTAGWRATSLHEPPARAGQQPRLNGPQQPQQHLRYIIRSLSALSAHCLDHRPLIQLQHHSAAVNHGSASIESTDEIDIGSYAEFNNNQNDAMY